MNNNRPDIAHAKVYPALRCKPFSGEPMGLYRVIVEDGQIWVLSHRFYALTTVHSLTLADLTP